MFWKPQIKGKLGYFGLDAWWLSTFTESERRYIEDKFRPLGSSDARPLTQGDIEWTTETAVGLLSGLMSWFLKKEDRHIARQLAAKGEDLVPAEKDITKVHYFYHHAIQSAYRSRDTEPGALVEAERLCRAQIAIAPQTLKALKKDKYMKEHLKTNQLRHQGYWQLSVILKKQKRMDEHLMLVEEWNQSGWR